MEFVLKGVKFFTPKLNKNDCFCNSNYVRYEEGAKFCLCENEYRKLKNYVDHLKYLECLIMIDDVMCDKLKLNYTYVKSLYDQDYTNVEIAISQIIQIEAKLEYLTSNKVTINSLDQEISNKVKLLKKEHPIVFEISKLARESKYTTISREMMERHLISNMTTYVLESYADCTESYKIAQEYIASGQLNF